jgi:hypothetical protein
MGRAINNENKLEDHERRLKLLEDAFEETLYTNKLSNKKQKKNAKNNAEA